MARQYRQNVKYDEIVSDSEGDAPKQEQGNRGNTGLPFGLCKKYGISLPANATPRDAWTALKNKTGMSPQDFYEKLKEGRETSTESAKQPNELRGQENSKRAVERMLTSDRIYYDKKYLTEDRIRANLEAATPEMRDLTVRLFNEDGFAYRSNERNTAFYPGYNKVSLREKDDGGGDSSYEKGECFFHETWHAIDGNYGDDAKIPMSAGYVLSTGKTVNETVREEARIVDWKGVHAKIEEEIDAYFRGRGMDRREIISRYEELRLEASRKFDEVYSETGSWSTAYTARENFEQSEEYKDIRGKYQTVSKTPREILRKWSDLSDMYSAATGKKGLPSIEMYHEKSYWKKKDTHFGMEIFAETCAARSVSPIKYAVLKEYLPSTVSGVEEIIEKLQKGEIKGNGKLGYAR